MDQQQAERVDDEDLPRQFPLLIGQGRPLIAGSGRQDLACDLGQDIEPLARTDIALGAPISVAAG